MENDGEVILQEILNKGLDEFEERMTRANAAPSPSSQVDAEDSKGKPDKENHSQWALGGNGRFMPVGATAEKLPAGVYEPFAVPGMWGLEKLIVASDGLYPLPDMATKIVLEEVATFWKSEAKYREHNLLYKRGIILWGPPGGGKTVAVKMLMNELVRQNGIVIVAKGIDLVILCLKAIRRIEPKRNLIVVFEDIDELIQYQGESGILSMLDGENNVDNILHLATTNYPEKLGARIINRPSRFDRRIFVDMPNAEAREAYLVRATKDGLSNDDLTKWIKDTEKMSIAHLRELVAAVYCLEQPYGEVIDRLKKMSVPVKGDDGFNGKKMGFASKEG